MYLIVALTVYRILISTTSPKQKRVYVYIITIVARDTVTKYECWKQMF